MPPLGVLAAPSREAFIESRRGEDEKGLQSLLSFMVSGNLGDKDLFLAQAVFYSSLQLKTVAPFIVSQFTVKKY